MSEMSGHCFTFGIIIVGSALCSVCVPMLRAPSKEQTSNVTAMAAPAALPASTAELSTQNATGNDYEKQLDEMMEKIRRGLPAVRISCEKGDAHACMIMADTHLNAPQEFNNHALALKFANRSCELGNGEGCYMLGNMSILGQGGAVSLRKALTALDRGCDLKFAESCHALGHAFLHQKFGINNFNAALGAFLKACELKNEEACDDLKHLEPHTSENGAARNSIGDPEPF